jgi:hypothetical protein
MSTAVSITIVIAVAIATICLILAIVAIIIKRYPRRITRWAAATGREDLPLHLTPNFDQRAASITEPPPAYSYRPASPLALIRGA